MGFGAAYFVTHYGRECLSIVSLAPQFQAPPTPPLLPLLRLLLLRPLLRLLPLFLLLRLLLLLLLLLRCYCFIWSCYGCCCRCQCGQHQHHRNQPISDNGITEILLQGSSFSLRMCTLSIGNAASWATKWVRAKAWRLVGFGGVRISGALDLSFRLPSKATSVGKWNQALLR